MKKPRLWGFVVIIIFNDACYFSHPPQPSISISFITGAKTLLKILVNHYGIVMISCTRIRQTFLFGKLAPSYEEY